MGHHQPDQHHIVEVPEEEKETEKISEEILTENSPNLMKDMNVNIQEAQQTPNKINSKRPTSRHIIIKLSKGKES